MKKLQEKTIGVLTIIMMLGISPLSITYSFAEIKENESGELESGSKSIQYERFIVIFTEKVVNGKLEVQYHPYLKMSLKRIFSDCSF